MIRTAALLAALLAAAPALAQTIHLPLSCKSQAVEVFAQSSTSAISGWEASAASQHGSGWGRWNRAADRTVEQVNHSHYGLIWRARARPCALTRLPDILN